MAEPAPQNNAGSGNAGGQNSQNGSRPTPGANGDSDLSPSVKRLIEESRREKAAAGGYKLVESHQGQGKGTGQPGASATASTDGQGAEDSSYEPLGTVNQNPADDNKDAYKPMEAVNQPPSPDAPGDYKPGDNMGMPEGWQAPQPDRSGLDKQAYDFGKGVGDLKSGLDRKHDEGIGQARQALAGGAGDGAKEIAGEAVGAKGSADPTKAITQKITTALGTPDKMTLLLVAVICLFALIISIPVINIPVAILLLVCLLASPKYTYKGTLAILSLIFGPEVYEFGTDIDPNQIKLKAWQKMVIAFEILLLAGYMIAMFVIVSYQACRVVTLGNSTAGYYASEGISFSADLFLGTSFQAVHDTCSKFMTSFDNTVGNSGSSYSPGVAAGSVQEYYGFIDQSAQSNNIPYCMLEALVRKESSGLFNSYSTFGNDQAFPPRYIDVNNSDKNYYGLSFNPYGHAIGLTQITIYPNGRGWKDANTPSRSRGEFGGSSGEYFTITDLLNPATNIAAGAHFYAGLLKEANGDPVRAYGYYQGGRNVSDATYNSKQFQDTLHIFEGYYKDCTTRT